MPVLQPALEQLAFQNVGCSINACASLAELVQNAQELRSLRLYNNMSDDAGAAAIAKVSSCVCDIRPCFHKVQFAMVDVMNKGCCSQQIDIAPFPLTSCHFTDCC